ncbi:S41 family peptidase [Fontivita pretiosa]|uniref:S41 family peptidase n=1 Tax=Fontivita pretiosa TaxID=2989684 RepID=UPI003D174E22
MRTGVVIIAMLGAMARIVSLPAVAAPPRVLRAAPDHGDNDVDPSLNQIVIEFDQPMDPAGHSVVGSGPGFPRIVGQPMWKDERTYVIPVRLVPRYTYTLSINSKTFTNFRNRAGESAVPYPITFTTGTAREAAASTAPVSPTAPVAMPTTAPATTLPAESNRRAIAQLRRAIDQQYAHRDSRKVDWPARFEQFSPRLQTAPTRAEFASLAAEMLAPASDPHLFVRAGAQTVATCPAQADDNLNFALLPKLIPQWRDHEATAYTGQFPDGVAYLLIMTWSADRREAIEQAWNRVHEAAPRAIIIDVRGNSGGKAGEATARRFASRFTAEPRVYARHQIRQDGQWLGPFDRTLEPAEGQARYSGRLVVLQGPQSMAENELFLLMMRACGAALVGRTSYGSSGDPQPLRLENGVQVYLSSRRDLQPDGAAIEAAGIRPDVQVDALSHEFGQNDPVLEAALKILRP